MNPQICVCVCVCVRGLAGSLVHGEVKRFGCVQHQVSCMIGSWLNAPGKQIGLPLCSCYDDVRIGNQLKSNARQGHQQISLEIC